MAPAVSGNSGILAYNAKFVKNFLHLESFFAEASRIRTVSGKQINYIYLAVETLTPGPMVEATVQERIY